MMCDDDIFIDDWEPPKPPTPFQILRGYGLRAFLHMRLERLCVRAIRDMHKDARQHGYNLARPGYVMPFWFKFVSRLEFWLRP